MISFVLLFSCSLIILCLIYSTGVLISFPPPPISQPFCSTFWDISSNLSFISFVEFFIFATRNFQKLFLFVLTMFFSYSILFLFCGCSTFLSLRMLKIFKKNFLLLHTLFPLLPLFLFVCFVLCLSPQRLFFYPLKYLINFTVSSRVEQQTKELIRNSEFEGVNCQLRWIVCWRTMPCLRSLLLDGHISQTVSTKLLPEG